MASLLPLNIKKEDDSLPRASLFPKRKPAIANIPPRARFAKARPNIGGIVSKATKDTHPSEAEKKNVVAEEPKSNETKEKSHVSNNADPTVADENLQSSENAPIVLENPSVKEENEILQRPSALPKRTLATPTAPRARYQKARPNIAAIASKKSKSVNTSNNSVEMSSSEKPVKDSPESKQTQDEVENGLMEQSTSGVKPFTDPVRGFSFSKGVIKVFPESNNVEKENAVEEQSSEILETLIVESLYAANEEEEIIQNSEDCVVSNSVEEQECSETTAKDPLSPEKNKSNYLKILSKTMARSTSEAGKEGAASTSVFSKANEYPTLKSILNSPRKRLTTKKTYERKRRLANLSETPSRSEMTMTDLIYYNPAGEPMKVTKPQTCAVENLPADENTKPIEEEPPEEDDNSNPPVPKVIINEAGEIIIDESSLVVRRKETIDTSIEAIIENDNTTYSSFRKKSARQWSNKETSKFYKALSLVGTDFALMENIFTVNEKITRSRRELKLKFKREEKLRLDLVHKAMYETQTYDISILEDDPDDFFAENVDEPPEPPAPKKRGRKPKVVVGNENKPNALRKKNNSTNESTDENAETFHEVSDDESNDVLYLNDQAKSNNHESNPDDDQTSKSPKMSRPQRARKNKILPDYVTDVDESENSDDYLSDSNSEATTKKKPPDTSEIAESTDNNVEGQSASIEKPKRGRKRKSLVLPPDYFDTSEAQDTRSPSETKCTVSRLGRVRRKTRVLTDFITEEEELEEIEGSDDESVIGVGNRKKALVLPEDSNDECYNEKDIEDSCIMVEQIDSLPNNSNVEVISKVKEESPELLVIPQNPTENDQDTIFLPSLREQDSCNLTDNPQTTAMNTGSNLNLPQPPAQNEMSSSNSINNATKMSPVANQQSNIGIKRKAYDGEIQCIELEQPGNEHVINLVAAASEVVVTDSTKSKRMRRRAAMPNVAQAKRRPGVEVEVPHAKPSFFHFTPKEYLSSPPKTVVSIKTYSRNIKKEAETVSSMQVESEVSIINPDNSAQNNNNLITSSQNNSVPGTSFQNNSVPQTSLQNNSVAGTSFQRNSAPGTSYQTNPARRTSFQTSQTVGSSLDDHQMPLNPTNVPQNNQTICGSTLSFPNSQAITLDSDGTSTDPPPVMIFTKSPNNENILHLFMVQSPKPTF